jgi:hypothetical protein
LIATFFLSLKVIAQTESLPTKNLKVSVNKGPLAGRILHMKALKIQTLEAAGFICPVAGETIEIKKQNEKHKYPTSYFIPLYIQAKYPPTSGKLILGYYSGTFTITCTHPAGAVETVILDSIQKYNVSKSSLGIFQF